MPLVNVLVAVEMNAIENPSEVCNFIKDALPELPPTMKLKSVQLNADVLPEQIYTTLTKQDFADFHDGPFLDHIGDSQAEPKKPEVLNKIKQLFNIK